MKVRRMLSRISLGVFVAALGGAAAAVAQKPVPKPKPAVAPAKPTPPARNAAAAKPVKAPEPKIPESFSGIASKLNTTPAALETAFEAAKATNPKLTHGQFIAANVVAQNLSGKNPAITVQALLDGLKSGKSIGKTLQGLGLSAKDADAAEDAAQKEVKAAEKAARESAEEAKDKKPDKDDLAKAPKAPKIPESFNGIASKLNTTPAALETAFEAARAANPKLTHGQFLAANVVAQNLGGKNPAITVQALLDGLKSGKSIGKTLQGLGLSAKDADAAEDAAEKELKAAGKPAKP